MPYDHARNHLCQMTLDNGFDYCLMLDSDIVAPNDTILRLLAHNLPIVSGMYHRRSPPHSIPVMIKDGQWVTQFPQNALIEVDYVGSGCLLIHRSVLEQMPPIEPGHHWFCWRVDRKGIMEPGECLSEDFTFCRYAKKTLGVKTIVDTSIQCRHIGLAEATYGRFVPAEATPIT